MDFHFNRKGFEKKTKLLTYLVNATNYLILITGSSKVGKTTFVEDWLSNKDNLENNSLDNILTTKINLDYDNTIDLESIKQQCVNNWQLNINENFVIDFNDVIANIPKDTMYQYLLVIDNAERLSKDVMQELIKINAETKSLVFRLVLVGNNSLSEHVSKVIKNDKCKIYNFYITPLSFKETRLFIIEFYKKHNRTVPFNYKKVLEIYKNSSGIIINITREIRSFHSANKAKPRKIQNSNFTNINKDITNLLNNIFKIKDKISLSFVSEYKEFLINISIASLGMIIIGLFIFQDEIKDNLNSNGIVATNNNHDITLDVQTNKIKSIESYENLKIDEKDNPKKIVETKPLVKISKKIEKKIEKFEKTKDTPHILSLNNNNYTIQLGDYLNKKDAISFINKNIKNYDLREDFKIVAAKRNDKVYYLVLYGDFANNADADNYVKIMKQSLKDNGAWIRQIASVKSDINNLRVS